MKNYYRAYTMLKMHKKEFDAKFILELQTHINNCPVINYVMHCINEFLTPWLHETIIIKEIQLDIFLFKVIIQLDILAIISTNNLYLLCNYDFSSQIVWQIWVQTVSHCLNTVRFSPRIYLCGPVWRLDMLIHISDGLCAMPIPQGLPYK